MEEMPDNLDAMVERITEQYLALHLDYERTLETVQNEVEHDKYQLLNENEENEENSMSDDIEPAEDVFEQAAAPPISDTQESSLHLSKSDASISEEHDSIPLDSQRVSEIQSLMNELDLELKTPDWAKNLPPSYWKETFPVQIREQLVVKKE